MAALYDDGCSTESEYYLEDAEQEEAPSLDSARVPEVEQETLEVAKRLPEYADQPTGTQPVSGECWPSWEPYSTAANDKGVEETLRPPAGSEWSHGGVSDVCVGSTSSTVGNATALEAALQMAAELEAAMNTGKQSAPVRELEEHEKSGVDPGAADTDHCGVSSVESTAKATSAPLAAPRSESKAKLHDIKSAEGNKRINSTKSGGRIVSLKFSSTGIRRISGNLRQPSPRTIGAPRELSEELSVPRYGQKKKSRSPTRERDDKIPSIRSSERHGSRSRSRSRPRSSRHHSDEHSRRPRTRSRSRSRSTSRSTASRLRSVSDRSYRTVRRSRSASRHRDRHSSLSSRRDRSRSPVQSRHSTSSHDRYHKRDSSGYSRDRHSDSRERHSEQKNEAQRDDTRERRANEVEKSRSPLRRKQRSRSLSKENTVDKHRARSDTRNTDHGDVKPPRGRENEPASRQEGDPRRSSSRASSTAKVDSDRSADQVRPHFRPRIEASSNRGEQERRVSSTREDIMPPLQENNSKAKVTTPSDNCPDGQILDKFSRKVHKYLLREADVRDQLASKSLSSVDHRLLKRRQERLVVDREGLEAQNLELFAKLHETMTVTPAELKQYRKDRSFSWRVVCYKRQQIAVVERRLTPLSVQERSELEEEERKLEVVRATLIRENSSLFHTVLNQNVKMPSATFQAKQRAEKCEMSRKRPRALGSSERRPKAPNKRQAVGPPTSPQKQSRHENSQSSGNAVVVGAALQLPPRTSA